MHVLCKLGDSGPNACPSYRADKPNFLKFWVKMAKMTLKVIVDDLHFQYQLIASHDPCLVQIWWFQLKSVTSYRADKVTFTDRQTDKQTDRQADTRTDTGNENTPSAWKAKGKSVFGNVWNVLNFHRDWYWFIVDCWHIFASENSVIIDSNNGSWPARC